jgi:hypothetical protein
MGDIVTAEICNAKAQITRYSSIDGSPTIHPEATTFLEPDGHAAVLESEVSDRHSGSRGIRSPSFYAQSPDANFAIFEEEA